MSLTRIGSIGINTGIAFAGVTTIVTLNTANDALSIGATVNVGSGITLGASGDIFATGVSTVTTLKVGSGVTVSSDGDIFATGVCTATSFVGDGANLTNVDVVSDTSPQLGGNLETNDKNIVFGDSSGATVNRLALGAGTDFSIYHNGTNTILDNNTGNLQIDTTANEVHNVQSEFQVKVKGGDEDGLKVITDGAVELYYNNDLHFATTADGVKTNGDLSFRGDGDTEQILFDSSDASLKFTDNKKAKFGTGDDLEIFHDGNSKIQNVNNSTDFRLISNSIELKSQSGDEFFQKCTVDGAVELYHDNSKKLATTTTGIDINTGDSDLGSSVKLYGHDALKRGRWGYSSSYKGVIVGRTDSNVNSSIFMGVDPSGNTNGGFGGYGQEIIFRNDLAFYHPNNANDGWKTFMRTGQFADTGAVQFPNGLGFGSDTATANILDDYEEGTYTPAFSTGMSGISYITQTGNYVKIGKLVRFDFYIQVNGGVSNAAIIAFTLPMNSDAGTNNHRGSGVITYHNINDGNQGTNIFPALYIGTNSAQCYMGGEQWKATSGSAQSNRYFIGGGTFHST